MLPSADPMTRWLSCRNQVQSTKGNALALADLEGGGLKFKDQVDVEDA